MAAATTARFGEKLHNTKRPARRRGRGRYFIETPDTATRIRRFAARAFLPLLLVGAILLTVSAAAFAYFYNQYSIVVEQRVRSGFWQSRGGVYAAPYRLRVGRQASRASVVDRLKRAGFVEGRQADSIWSGAFSIEGSTIRISANPGHARRAEDAEVKFAGSKIVSITVNERPVSEYVIDPEMLIGRTETKRTGSHVLKFEEIPDNLKNAIIIAEDQRFFSHYGIDPQGIARAFFTNISRGEVKQGGSTITQQLVKNTFLSPERSFKRKFSEAFLALAVENNMTKEQIFALYCNEIYLGQYGSSGVHGVKQAAKAYFDKDLGDLTLAESAAVAAMIKNPNRFGPHKQAEGSRIRRENIIAKMAEAGHVSAEEAELAASQVLKLAPPTNKGNAVAPYFVDAATRELNSKFEGDYMNANFNTRIYTTIDTDLQVLAEKAVAGHLAKLDKIYGKKGIKMQAALVSLDPRTGHVLAMVGGRDYIDSQFNRAADAKRQPGSTFKPFVYATALERGYTPISTVSDRPTEFTDAGGKPYRPANYGDSYLMSSITLKSALARSSNVAAVHTAFEAGLKNVAAKAEKFGFENVEPYPSMALGTFEVTPLELAAAYASFANGGFRVEPVFVDKIVSGDEDTLYISVPPSEQIISEKNAYMITDMLQAVVERGTARSANGALGKDVVFAGKTGSSKDGWFAGYTPNLVTVAWVGVDDNSDVHSTGGEIALPMWVDFMSAAVKTHPEYGGDAFAMPAGMSHAVVDPSTGMIADKYCPMREEVVMPASAFSNIKCLLHQPKPESFVAEVRHEETEFEDVIITIPAGGSETAPPSPSETAPDSGSGPPAKPNQNPRRDEAESDKRPVNDTFYLEFERAGKTDG